MGVLQARGNEDLAAEPGAVYTIGEHRREHLENNAALEGDFGGQEYPRRASTVQLAVDDVPVSELTLETLT
jgi:hypothetical protein